MVIVPSPIKPTQSSTLADSDTSDLLLFRCGYRRHVPRDSWCIGQQGPLYFTLGDAGNMMADPRFEYIYRR